jgi:hypothetical protein
MFSIKATMYPKRRAKSVDGSWRGTWKEAAMAWHAMVVEKGLSEHICFRPFVAEEHPKETAPCGDGKRYYRERPDLLNELRDALRVMGVRLAPG